MTTHARNEGPGGCVPWEKYATLSTESVRLAKALDALREDMQLTPGLHEAGDAWVATRERVDWLAETAAVMVEDDAGAERGDERRA